LDIKIIKHPLAQRSLTILRKNKTNYEDFRYNLEKITYFMLTYATEKLHTKTIKINTPLEETNGIETYNNFLIVPILRAGLGMLNPFLLLLPNPRVSFIGLKRDEDNLKPVEYYSNLPEIEKNVVVFILDPMLATGGSILHSIKLLKSKGADTIFVVSIITAPCAVNAIEKEFKDIILITASIDRELNTNGYILPGLGDAGDRTFGTFSVDKDYFI